MPLVDERASPRDVRSGIDHAITDRDATVFTREVVNMQYAVSGKSVPRGFSGTLPHDCTRSRVNAPLGGIPLERH